MRFGNMMGIQEWMASYGQDELGAMKKAMEGAKPEGARPVESASSGGARHYEGEQYRTPKEKVSRR